MNFMGAAVRRLFRARRSPLESIVERAEKAKAGFRRVDMPSGIAAWSLNAPSAGY
jgi:hypothetical protein